MVNTYTYDAYGNTSTSTGTVANPFKYSGQYTDSETGFLYLRARYYDPATQQFLTVDPLVASTEQAYAYVGGNPISYSDPSGRCVGPLLLVCIAGAAAGGEAVAGAAAGVAAAALGIGAFVTGIFAASQPSDNLTNPTDGMYTDVTPPNSGITSISPLEVTIGASVTAGGATCTLQFAKKGKGNVKDSELVKDVDAEARRTGKAVGDILNEWYDAARKAKDFGLADRIKATQKGLKTRPSRQSKDR